MRFGERLVGRDSDRRAFLPLSENLEQQFGTAPVQFHVAKLVKADQAGPAVAGDQLGQLPLIGGLGQLVDQLGGQRVTDPVAGLGGQRAQRDQQVRLPGSAIADQAKRVAGRDPAAGGQLSDHRRADRRVGVEGELLEPFRPREAGLAHPAGGAAPVPVVALGHHQLGQKPQVGQLLPLGSGGDLGEPVPDRGQPQHPAGLLDRRGRGLLGDPAPAGGHDDSRPSS